MSEARILVYTKPGCHLCEDLLDVVHRVLRGTGVPVTERNIALNLDDYERYKHAIPVLLIGGREVARYRISEAELRAALDAAGLP